MFNLRGQVIGIVSSILSRSGGFEGIGFAVTSNTAKALLLSRRSFWTGVDGLLLEPELAGLLNVPQASGLLVQHVAHGSPADQIGLQAGTTTITLQGRELLIGGDIILRIEGFALDGNREALVASQRHVQDLKPGDRLTMDVLRKGQVLTLSGIVK